MFDRVVSTVMTGIPALTKASIGANSALTSVGAMSRALGCFANSALTTGICTVGLKVVAPCHSKVTPSFLASAAAPLCIVM